MRHRPDLVTAPLLAHPSVQHLAEAAVLLSGFARDQADGLAALLRPVLASAPWRHMLTPGGAQMSVAMTNCGEVGWISDRHGYRYARLDPDSGQPWPPMPEPLRTLAQRAALASGFPNFEPDACLVNRYAPGTRLTLHQDRNESDLTAPVVSLSLGLPALFLFGGLHRRDPVQRVALFHGDVVVWGAAQRLAFHGVAPLADGEHEITGRCRINVTFRHAH